MDEYKEWIGKEFIKKDIITPRLVDHLKKTLGQDNFDNDQDIKDAKKMGITDLNKKYEIDEIVRGDAIFCASAITDTMDMKGVIAEKGDYYITETIVTHKSSRGNNMNIEKKKNNIEIIYF